MTIKFVVDASGHQSFYQKTVQGQGSTILEMCLEMEKNLAQVNHLMDGAFTINVLYKTLNMNCTRHSSIIGISSSLGSGSNLYIGYNHK